MCYQRILFTTGLKYLIILLVALITDYIFIRISGGPSRPDFWGCITILPIIFKIVELFVYVVAECEFGFQFGWDHNGDSIFRSSRFFTLIVINYSIVVGYLFYTGVL